MTERSESAFGRASAAGRVVIDKLHGNDPRLRRAHGRRASGRRVRLHRGHAGHHPHFLPPAFSDFQVESGGVGDGTITRFTVTAGGRTRQYRMTVAEPEPGRILTESDTGSSLVTKTTVTPHGSVSLVRISTTWEGAGGIGGFFERLFAPRVMRGIYADELERLQ